MPDRRPQPPKVDATESRRPGRTGRGPPLDAAWPTVRSGLLVGCFTPHRLPSGERLLFANPRHANSGDSIREQIGIDRFLNEKKPSWDGSPFSA